MTEQEFTIETRVRKITFATSDGNTGDNTLLAENEQRVGFLLYNNSSVSLLINYNNKPASESQYTTKVGANSDHPYMPANPDFVYPGQVKFNPESAASGSVQVTEFVKVKKRTRTLTDSQ